MKTPIVLLIIMTLSTSGCDVGDLNNNPNDGFIIDSSQVDAYDYLNNELPENKPKVIDGDTIISQAIMPGLIVSLILFIYVVGQMEQEELPL
jgi:hypothetical protein